VDALPYRSSWLGDHRRIVGHVDSVRTPSLYDDGDFGVLVPHFSDQTRSA
jgi:hypothetical protein